MRPERFANRCSTEDKVRLVLRVLAGEPLAEVARDAERPPKQLAAWRDRFIAGGTAHFDDRLDGKALETLEANQREMARRLEELEVENRLCERRNALLSRPPGDRLDAHPTCSKAYAKTLEEAGVEVFEVPEWGTHVLVRDGRAGVRQAAGIRPFASLDPRCELRAGLERLGREGINSISLTTDPMWCPEARMLEEAFDNCRVFKDNYFVDRAAKPVQIRKRHRNRVNQARQATEIESISLGDHLELWYELYLKNVDTRQIAQPFSSLYFERLAAFPELQALAVTAGGEIVAMTLWLRHDDTLYFHDAASSEKGFELSASYAAFARVIEEVADCRYVFLGGGADFRNDETDGLAVFKRGFANSSLPSYICSSTLNRPKGRGKSLESAAASRPAD